MKTYAKSVLNYGAHLEARQQHSQNILLALFQSDDCFNIESRIYDTHALVL